LGGGGRRGQGKSKISNLRISIALKETSTELICNTFSINSVLKIVIKTALDQETNQNI